MDAKVNPKVDDIFERLTDHEQNQMAMGPAVTTITFMRGSCEKATKDLRERYLVMLKLNPWLCGQLQNNKDDKSLHLVYSSSTANLVDADLDRLQLFNRQTRQRGKVKKIPKIKSTLGFYNVCNQVEKSVCEIPMGNECIGNKEPLISLSILPDAERPDDTFVVIFSCSHVIVDGFTYYSLLSMLSSDGTPAAMNATRKHEITQERDQCMGIEESKWGKAGSTICNVVCSMLCSTKKVTIVNHFIDSNKIALAKSKAKQESAFESFVSTNDVITSSFGHAVSAKVMVMPINLREKMEKYTNNDAGNYEGALVLTAQDYQQASFIRKTLSSYPPAFKRETMTSLPTGCANFNARLAMCISWLFPVFNELRLDGCEQMLHMPHCDTKMIPFETAVVYRPRANQTAIAFFVRSCGGESLKSMMPIGGEVMNAEQKLKVGE